MTTDTATLPAEPDIEPDATSAEPTSETDDNALPSWDELLSTAQLITTTTRPKKARVDVPPAVVALLENARSTNSRVLFPITKGEAQISQLVLVLGSAGDLMKPEPASILVTTVDKDGKKTADPLLISHVRANIGQRRGGSKGKRKSTTVPAITGPANGESGPSGETGDGTPPA